MKLTMAGMTIAAALVLAPAALHGQEADSAVSVREATAAAEAWLALIDEGLYQESWDSASAAFRQAVASEDWERAVTQARAPFEPLRGRALVSAVYARDLPGAPPGEYVVLQYDATVVQSRTVVETVVPMKDPDGRWRISGYFIRPK